MTQTADKSMESNSQPATSTSPGQTLKAAREAQFRTQAEVADRLRLSVAIIKRIENDDYQQVAAPVYCKGYVRAYARLVDANEERVMQALQQYLLELPSQEEAAISVDLNPDKGASWTLSSKTIVQMVSLVVCFGLAVLVVLWWQGQHHHKSLAPMTKTISQTNPVHEQPAAPVFPVSQPPKPALKVPEIRFDPPQVSQEPAKGKSAKVRSKLGKDAYQFKITPVHNARH